MTPPSEDRPRAGLSSPTVRRWELASRLRDLRLASGMTIEDVARRLMVSPAKISRIETNERMPQPRDIRDLTILYGVGETQAGELMDLVRGAKERAWWQSYDSLPEVYRTFIGLESAATTIREVDGLRISGLLQTPAYTRALIPAEAERRHLPDDYEQLIAETRERRKLRLTQEPRVRLHSITTEAALSFRVGSAAVMAEQLDHLLEVSALPNVVLQVVPFFAGASPALHGTFQIMEFAPELMSDVIFVEGLIGNYFFDKERDVRQYVDTFASTSELALSAPATRKLLLAIRASWRAA